MQLAPGGAAGGAGNGAMPASGGAAYARVSWGPSAPRLGLHSAPHPPQDHKVRV